MKLALILSIAQLLWSIRAIGPNVIVIDNYSTEPLTCYVHYIDGDFESLYVRPFNLSRPIRKFGIASTECY